MVQRIAFTVNDHRMVSLRAYVCGAESDGSVGVRQGHHEPKPGRERTLGHQPAMMKQGYQSNLPPLRRQSPLRTVLAGVAVLSCVAGHA